MRSKKSKYRFLLSLLVPALVIVTIMESALAEFDTPTEASFEYDVSTEAELRDAAAAINAATVGQYVISLKNDISLIGTSSVEFLANETTILGNGYTLYWDGIDDSTLNHSLFNVSGSTTVLNLGTSEKDDILFIDGNQKNSKRALILVTNGARITMHSGTTIRNIFRQAQGSALRFENSTFDMYGGKITGCSNTANIEITNLMYRGSAFYAVNSVINIHGGEISENRTDTHGVIYLNNCTFTLYGGRIANNKSAYSGGAICASASKINLLGGEITGNYCGMQGGGVFAGSASAVYLNGSILSGNKANFEGGAIALAGRNSTFVMDSGSIEANTADSGAGIYLHFYADARINGGRITKNEASSGAALYLRSSANADIYGGSISGNIGGVSGAVFIWGSTATLHGGTISGNTAQSAAAVRVWLKSTFNILGGDITGNSTQAGGTISLYGNISNTTCILNMSGGTIKDNTAKYGGAILSESATINIYNGHITDNHAVGSLGGGVYALGATILNIGENTHLYNNVSDSGGDDIYFTDSASFTLGLEPATLNLNDTFHDAKLAECGDPITGWYIDGMIDKIGTPRWNTHNSDKELYFVELSETEFKQDIALKAAHGLIGNILVSKTVEGSIEDSDREFSFQIVLSNTKINGTYGDLFFENGIASFTLKNGESKTAASLPAGTDYTISESDNSEYIVAVNGTSDTVAVGKIEANTTLTAEFTNREKTEGYTLPHTGGIGTQLFKLCGILLLSLCLLYGLYVGRSSHIDANYDIIFKHKV